MLSIDVALMLKILENVKVELELITGCSMTVGTGIYLTLMFVNHKNYCSDK